MKFTVATFLSALLAFAACLFFPWWSIAVTSFIVGLLIHQKAGLAYLASFTGVSLLWSTQATFIDFLNHHLLAIKIANVFPLAGAYVYLIIITAFIGGLVSGFGAMTGSYLRRVKNREVEDDSEVIYG
jgi:hypothetical protein